MFWNCLFFSPEHQFTFYIYFSINKSCLRIFLPFQMWRMALRCLPQSVNGPVPLRAQNKGWTGSVYWSRQSEGGWNTDHMVLCYQVKSQSTALIFKYFPYKLLYNGIKDGRWQQILYTISSVPCVISLPYSTGNFTWHLTDLPLLVVYAGKCLSTSALPSIMLTQRQTFPNLHFPERTCSLRDNHFIFLGEVRMGLFWK